MNPVIYPINVLREFASRSSDLVWCGTVQYDDILYKNSYISFQCRSKIIRVLVRICTWYTVLVFLHVNIRTVTSTHYFCRNHEVKLFSQFISVPPHPHVFASRHHSCLWNTNDSAAVVTIIYWWGDDSLGERGNTGWIHLLAPKCSCNIPRVSDSIVTQISLCFVCVSVVFSVCMFRYTRCFAELMLTHSKLIRLTMYLFILFYFIRTMSTAFIQIVMKH